ncbi:MAG: STAS domain-containing protein [Bacteroidales bacterium]|jgi:anti-anti-sigma regulatory factor|nr:STAS domain-containing protein [Bacteroidales bacterium]
MQIKKAKSKGVKKVNILLDHDLTIYTIEEIKDKIIQTFNANQEIDFTLKNVNNLDLSFIQFLYSLSQSAKARGKRIVFTAEFNDEIQALLENSDIRKIFKA